MRQVRVVGVAAAGEGAHGLVDQDRHVGHHAHDRHGAAERVLDRAGRHAGRHRDHGLGVAHPARDLLEERVHVLRLGGQQQDVGVGRGAAESMPACTP